MQSVIAKSYRSVVLAIIGVSTTIASRYIYFCCILAREETNLKQVKRSHDPVDWIVSVTC